MKKNSLLFILFLSSLGSVLAQNKIDFGATINGEYSIYSHSIKMDCAYKPMFPNTYPIDFGGYAEYKFLKRFSIYTGLGLGFEKFKPSYKDVMHTDSLMNSDETANRFELQNNPVMYQDNMNLLSVHVPVKLKFYVFSKFFISGGISFKCFLNKRMYNFFEVDRNLGFGMQFPGWSWGISIAEPTRINGIKMINNIKPNYEYEDYLIFSKRSVMFSVNYLLSKN
ncbi:MAG: hypothetical protein PF541_06465 [Prolixibacteraceae bacterium]|jgi:hypothetical protein|nr:hypothetical protein [Prolixibacteraceae bacterium]